MEKSFKKRVNGMTHFPYVDTRAKIEKNKLHLKYTKFFCYFFSFSLTSCYIVICVTWFTEYLSILKNQLVLPQILGIFLKHITIDIPCSNGQRREK